MAAAQRNQGGATDRSEGPVGRARRVAASGAERARRASERHASIALPFHAAERNRAVAASVLAGGVAYRLFLWLLPFALIVGGVLGLGDAQGIEEAVSHGGLPAAVVAAFGDVAQSADTNSWWLLLTGVPLLLWEGYAGAKGLQLIHSIVWQEPARRSKPLVSSLLFSAGMCTFVAVVSLAWWVRDSQQLVQLPLLALMAVPIGGLWLLVSLRLPHGSESWKVLLPGAILVGIGFQVTHGLVVYLLAPKLDKSTSLYGALGITTSLLFFLWVLGWIVVTAPILNRALADALRQQTRRG
jgi:uncharacterized BrkB/YihY/UPF0761 family membrane protein